MILVIGGAGYIGSHYVRYAREQGEKLVVLDNLVYGHREAVPDDIPFVQGDMGDAALLDSVFTTYAVRAVVHFAAFAYVGESVTAPAKYYANNTVATLAVLDAMVRHNVKNIVFSSTCATFGNPHYIPMDEKHPQDPINPYGESKYFVERILRAYDNAYGLRFVALRYFNAAGADPDGVIGESHDPETHLIPVIFQAAMGKRASIKVFGTDYNTPDGTCIRDYIHILDLAQAHALALKRLEAGGSSDFFNLGNGQGFSVQEVIAACEKASGKPVPVEEAPRRAGDPPRLIGCADKAHAELGWKPQYADIDTILAHAWKWEQNRRY